jgi:hydrogenase maturation protein HypF
MLKRRLNAPLTSSCGRLFDAVAALLGLRQTVAYEGQAAIELEALAETATAEDSYPFEIVDGGDPLSVDFRPMLVAMLRELSGGRPPNELARRFHHTLAAAAADTCSRIRRQTGHDRVVLSGGVFQNRLLSEMLCSLLEDDGFHVYTQRLVPPNDGGLALGQAIVAGRSPLCV